MLIRREKIIGDGTHEGFTENLDVQNQIHPISTMVSPIQDPETAFDSACAIAYDRTQFNRWTESIRPVTTARDKLSCNCPWTVINVVVVSTSTDRNLCNCRYLDTDSASCRRDIDVDHCFTRKCDACRELWMVFVSTEYSEKKSFIARRRFIWFTIGKWETTQHVRFSVMALRDQRESSTMEDVDLNDEERRCDGFGGD